MIGAGFAFTNPLTDSRFVVVAGDAETGSMGWTLEVRCRPGTGPDILEHLHLNWTETFEIVAGSAHYRLDGLQKTAGAGETIVMPPRLRQVHPWNAGAGELVYRQTTRFEQPDDRAFQEVIGVFATLAGLARAGKVDGQGLPKNPLQLAAITRILVRYDGYDARLPIPAQKFLAATLGRLAEGIGYRGVRPETWEMAE